MNIDKKNITPSIPENLSPIYFFVRPLKFVTFHFYNFW